MLMIRSIVRTEKADAVLAGLLEAGYPAVTRISVYGRGKQRGLKVGSVTYDELPKELLLTVIKEKDKDFVVKTIIEAAKTGDMGAYGETGKFSFLPYSRPILSVPVLKKYQPRSEP